MKKDTMHEIKEFNQELERAFYYSWLVFSY